MPIVLELTGGRPQLTMGTLQADGHHTDGTLIHNDGLSLHRAADDGWGGIPFPSPEHVRRRLTQDGEELRCTDFVFFPYLDDVGPGDGGLVVLPGSHKARYPRPAEMFGPFAQQHHMGHNGQHTAQGLTGTTDRSDHPSGLHLPQHPGGLPVLPAGMLNLTASAGDILMIPEALVHGSLPWRPRDRQRRVLVLRYRPHDDAPHTAHRMPEEVRRRLSPDTIELTAPEVATAWKKSISRRGVPLSSGSRL
jgi:hypothetical protein